MTNELKQERSREPISQVKDIEVLHYNPFPVTPIKPISIKGFWVTERPPFPFTYNHFQPLRRYSLHDELGREKIMMMRLLRVD